MTHTHIIRLSLLALLGAGTMRAQTPATGTPSARIAPARIDGATGGGLRWLAEHQLRNGADKGAWPVNTANYRPAIASLAGLAFLANGHLPGTNTPYARCVSAALKYVVKSASSDGYAGQGDKSGMYIHAICSLFVLSCYGMQAEETLDPELANWCRRSIEIILRAQQMPKSYNERGGWRYEPGIDQSDVSVTCWQLLVLHSARQAGFEVEQPVFHAAMAYLNRAYIPLKEDTQRTDPPAGGYLYRPGFTQEPERPATALVLFIHALFDAANEQRTQAALTYLRRYPITWDGAQYGGYFYFSGFYMMQGMFQVGGPDWAAFRPRMASLLLDHQSGDGSWPYPPNSLREDQQTTGPAYPVAMAVLMLSLDKQYLPMYQRQRRLYERVGSTPPDETPAPTATPPKDPAETPPATPTPDKQEALTLPTQPPEEKLALPPPPPEPPAAGNDGEGEAEEGNNPRPAGRMF
jgi:hypothetical protein